MAKVRFGFWNVKRLGQGTDQVRAQVLNGLMEYWKADLYVLCELMTTSTVPPAQNLTYRKEDAHQLCYAAWDSAGTLINLTPVTPTTTNDYKTAKYKGGNDFKGLADRALAYVGRRYGIEIFAIHAPAFGTAGLKAMAFIATYMNDNYKDNPWIVFGDFNCEPDTLAQAPTGINLGDLIRKSGLMTHLSSNGAESELDYAICNFPAKVTGMRSTRWKDYSDHSPILIEFETT
jgi:endonuclease/exonuclease/phosphatase (EEP) superfamily protein YafD